MVLLKNSKQKSACSEQRGRITIFSLLAVFCMLLSGSARAEEKAYKITIEGMHCKMCVYRVTKSLKRLKQVKDVDVSLDKGTATVTLNEGDDVTTEAFNEAVENSGYKPNGVEVLMASNHLPDNEKKEENNGH